VIVSVVAGGSPTIVRKPTITLESVTSIEPVVTEADAVRGVAASPAGNAPGASHRAQLVLDAMTPPAAVATGTGAVFAPAQSAGRRAAITEGWHDPVRAHPEEAAMFRTACVALTGTVAVLSGCGSIPQLDRGPAPTTASTAEPTSTATPAGPAPATPTPSASTRATPTPSATKPLAKSRSIYWPSAKPGMCLVLPDKDLFNVTRTDCRVKHHAEVTARSRLRGGAWPGGDALDQQASTVCQKAFARYVGLAVDDSLLDFDYITADRAGWEDGAHTVICLVFDPSQEWTTRALKGSHQ